MPNLMTPEGLKSALHDGSEIALFDIREHGQFGEAHPFFAVPLPYSRLEVDVVRLAPRRDVRLVVYGDGNRLASKAAQRLEDLGYTRVSVLAGGIAAWRVAGFSVFAGVNVPSKAFGELVEKVYGTPQVSPAELARWLARKENLVVLDGRPLEEFTRMSIPGAICCPNGELAYRWRELVPNESTRVVINCAGRTRSIIGAQTLINLGVPNPVYALENGTQGWMLADLTLNHLCERRHPGSVGDRSLAEARVTVNELSRQFGVPFIDAQQTQAWLDDPDRTTFLLDVRTADEFAASSLHGAQHAPGGQLIQATDQFVGVRGARLVLFDGEGVRAPVVASWLRQMGWDASVLEGGTASGFLLNGSMDEEPAHIPALPVLPVPDLAKKLSAQSWCVVDLRSSASYRQAHIPGATWSVRPKIAELLVGEKRPVVLVADAPFIAELAASELDIQEVWVLGGGFQAWQGLGLAVKSSPDQPADEECIDFLFFTHDRHDGNKESARQYLAWEIGLLAQLDEQELGVFRPGFVGSGGGKQEFGYVVLSSLRSRPQPVSV